MADCCGGEEEAQALQAQQRSTLIIVLAINVVMFLAIAIAGFIAQSTALLSDSLDNFGDAVTYGLSLYAVSLGLFAKARVAFAKGLFILLSALFIAGQIIYRLLNPSVPVFELMGIFSLLGLLANGVCLRLLWRHRRDDVNMSSIWECSRNDIVANLSVFVAAIGVWLAEAGWPDLLVASLLVVYLARSATRVLLSSIREMRAVVG